MKIPTFTEWLKANKTEMPRCDCGAPQYGQNHSPTCEYILGMDVLDDEYEDYKFQIEEEALDHAVAKHEKDMDKAGEIKGYNEIMDEREAQ